MGKDQRNPGRKTRRRLHSAMLIAIHGLLAKGTVYVYAGICFQLMFILKKINLGTKMRPTRPSWIVYVFLKSGNPGKAMDSFLRNCAQCLRRLHDDGTYGNPGIHALKFQSCLP